MPKTKFQDFIFTFIMVIVMVYAMVCYNTALNTGGLTNTTFIIAFKRTSNYGSNSFFTRIFLNRKLI